MNPNAPWIIPGIAAVLIVGMILLISLFSRKAVVRRKLKKATGRKISDFVGGEFAKIVGKVEIAGQPLTAPLSKRSCAYYHVLVEQRVSSGKGSHWQKIIEEEKAGEFVIRDGRYCAHVNFDHVKSYLVEDKEYRSGFMNDAPEILERFLNDHGKRSENFMGMNKALRYKEGVVEQGETIAVAGKGEWKPADQLQLPDLLGKVLEMTSSGKQPVYLSDDPVTLKIKNPESGYYSGNDPI